MFLKIECCPTMISGRTELECTDLDQSNNNFKMKTTFSDAQAYLSPSYLYFFHKNNSKTSIIVNIDAKKETMKHCI